MVNKFYLVRVHAESNNYQQFGDVDVKLPEFSFEKAIFCTESRESAISKYYEISNKYYGKAVPWVSNRMWGHSCYVELFLEEYRVEESDVPAENEEGYLLPIATIEGETWEVYKTRKPKQEAENETD